MEAFIGERIEREVQRLQSEEIERFPSLEKID
jgi:hypothetical protein